MKLHLVEEVMLLVLHDDGGEFAKMRDWPMRCALAGGVLMDLVLQGRIAVEPEMLRVLDADSPPPPPPPPPRRSVIGFSVGGGRRG